MEFIRMRNGAERIVDVCRISGDGMRVKDYFQNYQHYRIIHC